MTKLNFKIVGWLIVVVLVAASTSFLIVNLKNTKPDKGQVSTSVIKESANIETQDFSYKRPSGWAELSQEVLNSSNASSGIGRTPAPSATFTVRSSAATPSDATDLKNSTINELKNLSNFELINSVDKQVDGKSGQKFTYRYGNADKLKQELYVVVYKQKTFFLLFTSANADFDKQTGDFDKILADFKFK